MKKLSWKDIEKATDELAAKIRAGGFKPDLDMIELYDPDVDALGYVSPREMTEKVRVKQ